MFKNVFFELLQSENTRWGYIEKTVITTCNRLKWQCDQLSRESNKLYSLFNQLKCSSKNMKNIQEQYNRLQYWFNWLKCSWSFLEILSRMM